MNVLEILGWLLVGLIVCSVIFTISLLIKYSQAQRKEDKRKKKIADQAVELMIKERKKHDKELDEEQKNI